MLKPGDQTPAFGVETLRHGAFSLAEQPPPGGTWLVFHRGGHCKWTRLALKELDDRIGDFALRGIRVIAVSGESRDATEALAERMQLIRLPLGYGLDPDAAARDWGLCLTRDSAEEGAPPLHVEPGQFWVTTDGRLGAFSRQSGPNLWPDITQSLRGIDNTMNKFPERGAG